MVCWDCFFFIDGITMANFTVLIVDGVGLANFIMKIDQQNVDIFSKEKGSSATVFILLSHGASISFFFWTLFLFFFLRLFYVSARFLFCLTLKYYGCCEKLSILHFRCLTHPLPQEENVRATNRKKQDSFIEILWKINFIE